MKRFRFDILRTALFSLVLSCTLIVNAQALDKGDKAVDFTLPGRQGAVTLSDKAGSVIYLDFWASWCGPCRQSFPWMNQMQAKYKSKGFQVIAVNLDARNGDVMKFFAQVPADFTVAFDPKGQTPRLYGVKGMPTSFLIDRSGKILSRHLGFRADDTVDLERQIQAALEAR